MQTIELSDGGTLRYEAAFLPPELADRYFAEFRDHCAWEQKPGIVGHMQPRLIASYQPVDFRLQSVNRSRRAARRLSTPAHEIGCNSDSIALGSRRSRSGDGSRPRLW